LLHQRTHLHTSPSSSFLLNHTSPTDIYTLSLHDALPIYFSLSFSSFFSYTLPMKLEMELTDESYISFTHRWHNCNERGSSNRESPSRKQQPACISGFKLA